MLAREILNQWGENETIRARRVSIDDVHYGSEVWDQDYRQFAFVCRWNPDHEHRPDRDQVVVNGQTRIILERDMRRARMWIDRDNANGTYDSNSNYFRFFVRPLARLYHSEPEERPPVLEYEDEPDV